MTEAETLQSFTIENLPDLDVVVMGALELFEGAELPDTTVPFRRPLVIGSAGAETVGRILFNQSDAVFASESNFESAFDRVPEIDGAVLISASGGKHAVELARKLKERGLPAVLFTSNPEASAMEYFEAKAVRLFPKNREPYTYNTSTYLGMILADTGEKAGEIKRFIATHFADDLVPTLSSSTAFTFILPGEFAELRSMLRTKFDELFGPKLVGRFFTTEEVKHAKTVIADDNELFLNFTGRPLGQSKELALSLPERYAGALAATYFVVGLIQRSQPPYFKNNIVRYSEEASAIFGQSIEPIVD
ncbi:MAG: hypothetical protein WD605_01145 [Candidatus Paceibacterota bacterium]